MALGAMLATGEPAALLLVLLIGTQNLPEGFTALRELTRGRHALSTRRGLWLLAACALLGPLAALAGHRLLADKPEVLGAIMLAAAGGILYLTFQDIAPKVPLRRAWAPPLGAVAGFLVGVVGQMMLVA
jgi:ZIP family zinc transporter